MVKENFSDWSKEELVREIRKLRKRKKYGIVWDEEHSKETFEKETEGKLPVLKEIANREIILDPKATVNILVEGDNFHALSVFNYTHKGIVDIIYIDPPYNIGNNEFKFNDRIVDREDAYRHSKWLSFMNKRLNLAKNLLKDTGVIFISIDDNEHPQLKLLCDEIFGEKNFVANYIWESRSGKGATAKNVVNQHEYIICFAKNIAKLSFREDVRIAGRERKEQLRQWGQGDRREDRPTMFYPVKSPNGEDIYPIKDDGSEGRWRVGPRTMNKLIESNDVDFIFDGNHWQLYRKIPAGRLTKTPFGTFLMGLGTASTGTLEIKAIFGKKVFDTTKPLGLIKYLLNLVEESKNVMVLDFFAGSGSTGHAVLELNKEDGGDRRFILCTNNENNICVDVCFPRIKQVMKGYLNINGEEISGLGGHLKYFKTAFVDSEPTDANKKSLVEQSTEMLCLKEDCFDKVQDGVTFKIFKNNKGKYLGIIYDDEGIEPFKKEARELEKNFVIYVFSLDESAREEDFEDMKDSVKLKPIPAVILNVYKRIFK